MGSLTKTTRRMVCVMCQMLRWVGIAAALVCASCAHGGAFCAAPANPDTARLQRPGPVQSAGSPPAPLESQEGPSRAGTSQANETMADSCLGPVERGACSSAADYGNSLRAARAAAARARFESGVRASTGTALERNAGLQTVAFKPLLAYRGSYICAQGVTAVTVWVGDGTALFSFHAHTANPGVPSGSFAMRGQVDLGAGVMHLKGVQWIERPAGWVMVNLDGVSSDGGLSFHGTVTGPNCSSFSVSRAHGNSGPR